MSFPGFPNPPGPGSPPSPSTHNLLSTTHGDTTASAPLAGDIIISATGIFWGSLPVGAELDHLVVVAGTPTWTPQAGSGLGDVTGPSSANDNYIAIYDGISGKLIQQGLVTIDDFGNLISEGSIVASGGITSLGDIFVNNNLFTGGNTLISGDLTVLGNSSFGNLTITSGLTISTGTITYSVSAPTGAIFTITNSYYNSISSGTTTVNMPTSSGLGSSYVIKDIDGIAATTPITVIGNGNTIDGAVSVDLVNNYESITLIFGPTEWNII